MTTDTFTTSLDHTSDAGFRAWGLAFSNSLTASGLPMSGDTGQINWATATRSPPNSVSSGYEIRYLNDSLHATKPCYIKIEYGTWSTSANGPAIAITVASGTNGAGTVSGTTYFARVILQPGGGSLLAGTFPTFCCTKPGYTAFAMWRRIINGGYTMPQVVICRTTDSAGDITNTGFLFYYNTSTSLLYRKTYITSEISEVDRYCLIPGGITTTSYGGDVMAFRHYNLQSPSSIGPLCVPFVLSYFDADISNETTFSLTPIGVTSRTYLTLGGSVATTSTAASGPASARLAIQWD